MKRRGRERERERERGWCSLWVGGARLSPAVACQRTVQIQASLQFVTSQPRLDTSEQHRHQPPHHSDNIIQSGKYYLLNEVTFNIVLINNPILLLHQ